MDCSTNHEGKLVPNTAARTQSKRDEAVGPGLLYQSKEQFNKILKAFKALDSIIYSSAPSWPTDRPTCLMNLDGLNSVGLSQRIGSLCTDWIDSSNGTSTRNVQRMVYLYAGPTDRRPAGMDDWDYWEISTEKMTGRVLLETHSMMSPIQWNDRKCIHGILLAGDKGLIDTNTSQRHQSLRKVCSSINLSEFLLAPASVWSMRGWTMLCLHPMMLYYCGLPGGMVYFPTLSGSCDTRVVTWAGDWILRVSLMTADTYSNLWSCTKSGKKKTQTSGRWNRCMELCVGSLCITEISHLWQILLGQLCSISPHQCQLSVNLFNKFSLRRDEVGRATRIHCWHHVMSEEWNIPAVYHIYCKWFSRVISFNLPQHQGSNWYNKRRMLEHLQWSLWMEGTMKYNSSYASSEERGSKGHKLRASLQAASYYSP